MRTEYIVHTSFCIFYYGRIVYGGSEKELFQRNFIISGFCCWFFGGARRIFRTFFFCITVFCFFGFRFCGCEVKEAVRCQKKYKQHGERLFSLFLFGDEKSSQCNNENGGTNSTNNIWCVCSFDQRCILILCYSCCKC